MKKRLWRIIIGGTVYIAAIAIRIDVKWLRPSLFLISYIAVGFDVIIKAVKNILHGNVFDENFLMSIATIGAFFISQFPEAVAVMLFYQIGVLFQSYALSQSRKSISALMDIRPDHANVKRGDEIVTVDPYDVQVGDIIVVKAGEKVPLDAKIIEGDSMLDTSALTGESLPREVEPGSDILSGCININGVLTAEVMKEFGESTVSKILDLVENASSKKSHTEQFITKFARCYTPAVVISAVFLAVIPPLLIDGASFTDWIYRALSFLVVSCPCAMVISIPLSFFGGIGGASRNGILVKGSNYLEALAKTEIVVFDKTGTLTKGVFNVREVRGEGISDKELLKLTAYAESYSDHPIAQSIKCALGEDIDNGRILNAEEFPGRGVSAEIDGKKVYAGNARMMEAIGVPYYAGGAAGTVVHTAVDGKYAGYIVIGDEIKSDSARAIEDLKDAGIKRTVMLTGDVKGVADRVAGELKIDEVYSELLPADKVEKVQALFKECSKTGKLAFVGDGINDAPVLAIADIGIAMGGLGSDAAIEAADVVIMTDEPSKIATAIGISKNTLKIATQNTYFAIGVKLAVLLLSACGLATMWAAVFADVGVTVIAILNSFRALNVRRI